MADGGDFDCVGPGRVVCSGGSEVAGNAGRLGVVGVGGFMGDGTGSTSVDGLAGAGAGEFVGKEAGAGGITGDGVGGLVDVEGVG